MRRDHVIKHRAPNGALRQVLLDAVEVILLQDVIKHRAPNGALRPYVNRSGVNTKNKS